MTVQNDKIAAALATMRLAIGDAKAAEDVLGDKVALAALADIEARADKMVIVIEHLEQNGMIEDYSALQQELHELYRATGDLQAVAATAATRRGGYKGSATTNSTRVLSSEKRQKIKDDFERACTSGMAKEIAYRNVARHHDLSDRTIRRVVADRR